MVIPEHNQRELLFMSFRYALGRQTFAPSTIAKIIIDAWDELPYNNRVQYQKEIKEAMERGRSGMDCDTKAWQEVLDLDPGVKE